MHYKFYVKNPAAHYLYIDLTIDSIDSDEVLLQLPTWRPGRYELGNFAKNIKKFDAFNEKNELLQWTKLSKDLWKVKANGANQIKVTYSYFAADLNAGSTYVDTKQIYSNPVNCCMYVPSRMQEKHTIELVIPNNYTIATSLKKQVGNILVADNFEELADSPFIASSDIKTIELKIDKVNYFLHFNGECLPDEKLYKKDFTAFIKECVAFFGGINVDEYHFLFQVLPFKFYHGVEHVKSTVIGIGPGYNINDGSTYLDVLGVSCHELFHTWNVKTIRPVEMMPYNYTEENYSRTGYVYEGITTYYGDKLLLSSGVFNQKQYFDTLEERLNKHFHNFGRFNLSLADSSFETWLDGYVPGAPYRKVSIYDEGNLVAFMLDVLIMEATNNTKSLQDVMLVLYNDFYKKGKGYSEQDVLSIIHDVSGKDFDSFFAKYVYGLEEYEQELSNCFNYLGIQLTKLPAHTFYERYLGFKAIEQHGIKKVSLVAPYSPAWKAKLSPNDEIIAVNGFQVKNDLNNWLVYFNSKAESLKLTVLSNSEIKQIEFSGEFKTQYFDLYSLAIVNSVQEKQENNFKIWSKMLHK